MKKLLISTDIGDDVDDILALSYCHHHPEIEIVGIVLAHGRYTYRQHNLQELYTILDAPLPPTQIGSINAELIDTLLSLEDIKILSIGPTNELHHLLTKHPEILDHVSQVTYQGGLDHKGNIDEQAYNFKGTINTARQLMQLPIPRNMIGKHVAYELGISFDEMSELSETNSIGAYIATQATKRHQAFKAINPHKRNQIYGASPHICSYPYDLIAADTINDSGTYLRETYSRGKGLGNRQDHSALSPSHNRYNLLATTIGGGKK